MCIYYCVGILGEPRTGSAAWAQRRHRAHRAGEVRQEARLPALQALHALQVQ